MVKRARTQNRTIGYFDRRSFLVRSSARLLAAAGNIIGTNVSCNVAL